MSASIYHSCGCSFHQPLGSSGPVEVKPCSRHRELRVVQLALAAMEQAKEQLRKALRKAHEDLPPLQIEQEERQAAGDGRYR